MVLSQRTSDIITQCTIAAADLCSIRSHFNLITVNDYHVLNEHSRLLTRTKRSSASPLSKNYPFFHPMLSTPYIQSSTIRQLKHRDTPSQLADPAQQKESHSWNRFLRCTWTKSTLMLDRNHELPPSLALFQNLASLTF